MKPQIATPRFYIYQGLANPLRGLAAKLNPSSNHCEHLSLTPFHYLSNVTCLLIFMYIDQCFFVSKCVGEEGKEDGGSVTVEEDSEEEAEEVQEASERSQDLRQGN